MKTDFHSQMECRCRPRFPYTDQAAPGGEGSEHMAKKYRVAVIGRTGHGNYGHGLDVVWKALDNVEMWRLPTTTTRAGTRRPVAWE